MQIPSYWADDPSAVVGWIEVGAAEAHAADGGGAERLVFEEDVRAPEERHLDEAFFRGYQKLEPEAKEQLRKILSTFKKTS